MTIALENVADGSITDRNFQKLAQVTPDTGGKSLVIRGPYSFDSGSLASGGAVVIPFTHNANMPTTSYVFVGDQSDLGFGYYINWVITSRTANTIGIGFYNSGPGTASLRLYGYLIG